MSESTKMETPALKAVRIARAFGAVACLILALLVMTPGTGAMDLDGVAQPVSANSGGEGGPAILMAAPSQKEGAEHQRKDDGHHDHAQHCCGSSGCNAQIPYMSAAERQPGAMQPPALAEPAVIGIATPPPGEPPKPAV